MARVDSDWPTHRNNGEPGLGDASAAKGPAVEQMDSLAEHAPGEQSRTDHDFEAEHFEFGLVNQGERAMIVLCVR